MYDTSAARKAILVTFVYDLFKNNNNLRPPLSNYIAESYNLMGYITANDSILTVNRDVYYGLVLQSKFNLNDYKVVIRGTADKTEFFINLKTGYRKIKHRLAGHVEDGFYSIYETMKYYPVDWKGSGIVSGIAHLMSINPESKLEIIGHSLGSAIGTYLALDLHIDYELGDRISTCFFASPKPGDVEFAKCFDSIIKNYSVYNYVNDIVPKLPPEFMGYSSLPKAKLIKPNNIKIKKILGIFPSILCNHHSIMYASLLDPSILNEVATFPDDEQLNCRICIL